MFLFLRDVDTRRPTQIDGSVHVFAVANVGTATFATLTSMFSSKFNDADRN